MKTELELLKEKIVDLEHTIEQNDYLITESNKFFRIKLNFLKRIN